MSNWSRQVTERMAGLLYFTQIESGEGGPLPEAIETSALEYWWSKIPDAEKAVWLLAADEQIAALLS